MLHYLQISPFETLNPPDEQYSFQALPQEGWSKSLEVCYFSHGFGDLDGENVRIFKHRYGLTEFEECMVSLKALNISTYSLGGDRESHNLCSSYKLLDTSSGHQHDQQFGLGNKIDNCGDSGTSIDECFLLHYEAYRSVDLVRHKCTVFLNDVELHCYPYIFGLLVGFYDKISGYGTSSVGDNLVSQSWMFKILYLFLVLVSKGLDSRTTLKLDPLSGQAFL
ncbi:hypothetical protein CK203_089240 [Vitis vinifera]|uniref:Uncharacterized protein n=1 Tax=Vitis vinifera TaxID=29760 RepID=A0A438CZX5_VITVI|nr:hypothetical protein CK203_089240 [Vitis vinifera]